MELSDLNHDERLALVALIEFIGESQAETSEEDAEISRAVAILGASTWMRLAGEVDRRFHDAQGLKDFLGSIGRPEARALIFEAVLEVGLADGRALRHPDMLDWLRDTWQVELEVPSDSPT